MSRERTPELEQVERILETVEPELGAEEAEASEPKQRSLVRIRKELLQVRVGLRKELRLALLREERTRAEFLPVREE